MKKTTWIGVKNILISLLAAACTSAVIGLFRDNWTESFVQFFSNIATGLLAVASLWSARDGFEAGVRSAGRAPGA
jgi:hypothetical protein